MEQKVIHDALNRLKDEINAMLGFHEDTPRINYGPCGVFAKLFFDAWNSRFSEKAHICFIMTLDQDECDHVVIRLPSGELYDGGIGVHSDSFYEKKFIIEDMLHYDHDRLEKWSYGLDRVYPRFCPDFNKEKLSHLIDKQLNHLRTTLNSLDALRKTIINARGQSGKKWYDHLPETIQVLEAHWSLNDIQPVTNMSWNYVAFAKQNDKPVVLKISADKESIHHEYQALQHFSGIGAITVIDFHPKYHALLLQKAVPGTLLKCNHPKNMIDVINSYANVVRDLRLAKTPKHTFHHARKLYEAIDSIDDPRVPSHYIDKAKHIRNWIFETTTDEYVCHGDLHLENIIKHEKQWLAIDPKGIIGEMAFEASAFDLLNEHENHATQQITNILAERIQQLASALNLNEERLIAWIFLRTMLSIQWFLEDKGDPTKMLKMAEHLCPIISNLHTDEMAQQLKECVALLKSVFGSDLLGVYLYGSALVGGLQKYSDIDLFVITNRATTLSEKTRLANTLLQISGIYMKSSKRPIEMTIVEKTKINPWRYPPHFDFQYGDWLRTSFEQGTFEPWSTYEMPDLALIITQVFLKSETLIGKEPAQLLAPVPYPDFIKAMLHDLNRLGEDLLDDTRNVLLTYARIWSTLETNTIRSKPSAADWVMRKLPKTHCSVMNRAKLICTGVEDEYWDDIQMLIQPCADFMVEKINQCISMINFNDPSIKITIAQDS